MTSKHAATRQPSTPTPNEPTITPIGGLGAVILITPDIDAQRRFYADVLGLEVAGDYGDAVFFRLGDQTLAIFGPSHHPEGTRRLDGAAKGISHLEFMIPSDAEAEWDQRLRETGHHAYGNNYEDADRNLFHFTTPAAAH